MEGPQFDILILLAVKLFLKTREVPDACIYVDAIILKLATENIQLLFFFFFVLYVYFLREDLPA